MKKLIAGLCAGVCLLFVTAFAQTASAAGYTQTKYPIVLVHGLFGFDTILGVPYFYQIPDALSADGARVFVAQVSAVNNDSVRGEQLLTQVRQILATTGAAKVNLIGHSQGGLDVRYVAGVRPDLVASVTTVGTPHKGSTVADFLRGVIPRNSVSESTANAIINGFANLLDELSGGTLHPQDAVAALDALSSPGTAAFNRQFPAGVPTTSCGSGAAKVNNVAFYSWGGTAVLTNGFDASDAILGATGLIFGSSASDGLVGQCSSHLGQVIADNYFQNHLDEVNQTFGLISIFTTNPVTLFRQQANRLRNAGY